MTINITNEFSDEAILSEIGQRLRARRLKLNFTQEDVAKKAGLSIGTIRNLENGAAGSMPSVIAMLRALNALDQLNHFLSASTSISPLMALKQQRKVRQRARSHQNG
jgi:transcriptional regulator with XRE-family HTH domain